MLVLRRKTGEAIVLNQVVIIRVLGVEGDRVKIGIEAPPDVIVVREELLEESIAPTNRHTTQEHFQGDPGKPSNHQR